MENLDGPQFRKENTKPRTRNWAQQSIRFPPRDSTMASAEALLGGGHFGVAVDFLNAVSERFRQFPEFHYYLGLANFKLNKSTVALPESEEALRLDPNLHLAKFGSAACRATNGDLQGAADLSRALVREHPNNPRYSLALAKNRMR